VRARDTIVSLAGTGWFTSVRLSHRRALCVHLTFPLLLPLLLLAFSCAQGISMLKSFKGKKKEQVRG
jgi:hypothetical protein